MRLPGGGTLVDTSLLTSPKNLLSPYSQAGSHQKVLLKFDLQYAAFTQSVVMVILPTNVTSVALKKSLVIFQEH
jgi:hypothetical protein